MSHDPESYIKISKKELSEKLYPDILKDIYKVCTINTFKSFECFKNNISYNWPWSWWHKFFPEPITKLSLKDSVKYYKDYYFNAQKTNMYCWNYGYLYDSMDTKTYSGFIHNIHKLIKYSTDDYILMCQDDVNILDEVIRKASLLNTQEYKDAYEKYKELFAITMIGTIINE